MTTFDHLEADRLVRRRARLWPVLAILIVLSQLSLVIAVPARLADSVGSFRDGLWLGLTMTSVAALWTGGYWFKRRAVRTLLDDEVTRAHRADALAVGFLLAMLASGALYVATMIGPVDVRVALNVIVTAALVGGLLRFSWLERRALQDG